jgi:DNA-binding NarL/FixJ family response regulator
MKPRPAHGVPPKRTPTWWRAMDPERRDFWVHWHVTAGRTRAEIARQLRLTPTAVGYRYRRALRRLEWLARNSTPEVRERKG